MALITPVLYALLMLGTICYGLPRPEQNEERMQNDGNKYTAQELLDKIVNEDNPDLKSIFASGFEKPKVTKQVNKNHTEHSSKVQSVERTTIGQLTITTIPSSGIPNLIQNIGPGQSVNSFPVKFQGNQQRPDFGGLLNYGQGGEAQVHGTHITHAQAIGIQGARASEDAARAGQVNAIYNAQALDAARVGNVQRAQEASFEFTRASETARRAAAGTMVEVARAQEAGRIANAAHFQADRIANAARTNLAMAAARAAGPDQLSNIVNSATLALQAARETEAVARAGQANAIRNAQALDAMRLGNVQRAQAALWENSRAAESARQAAAGAAAEMARAAEAERAAYAARVQANAMANLVYAQATVARNAQESSVLYGGYGSYY